MKIIFLDVDGVLNNTSDLERVARHGVKTWAIDPPKMDRLAEIVRATGAKIVVSSDWRLTRLAPAMLVLKIFLANWDIPVYGETADMLVPDRVTEIKNWLRKMIVVKEKKIEGFLILDDRTDAGETLEDHFIQTDEKIGLSAEHVPQAIQILNTPLSDDMIKIATTFDTSRIL